MSKRRWIVAVVAVGLLISSVASAQAAASTSKQLASADRQLVPAQGSVDLKACAH